MFFNLIINVQRFVKYCCSFMIVSLFFTSMVLPSGAVQSNPYLESHEQINFEGMDLFISNNKRLLISISQDLNIFSRCRAQRDKFKLEQYISRYPDTEEELAQSILDSEELVVLSYTEAPLREVDGHLERIKTEPSSLAFTASAASEKTSGASIKYNFTLQTKIVRTDTKNSAGEYQYKTTTTGKWSTSSWIGGEKYPAGGSDFILQSVPTSMTIGSDSLRTWYFEMVEPESWFGRPGQEYWRENGGSSYIRYGVKDDPFGPNQLKSYDLFTTCWGKPSSATRKINSYYVHTWTEMTLSVSVSLNTSKEVGLTLSPGKEKKSWQLYNYVTFNF